MRPFHVLHAGRGHRHRHRSGEVIGGAIALNLLFGFPLFIGGLVIGAISTVMLWFQGGKTQTTFERIIIVMLLIITFGFIAGLFVAPPNPGEVVKGMIPRFQGATRC